MKPEIQLSSKTVFDGKLLHVTYDTVQVENGNESWREVVRHPGAVAILAVLPDGKIIMERQYRYAIGDTLLEIPAGKLDEGEEPLAAAKRELHEETGYDAEHWKKLGSIVTSPGFCDEVIHIFLATGLEKGEQQLDEDEFVEVLACSLEELEGKIATGELFDGKTIAGLMMAKPYL